MTTNDFVNIINDELALKVDIYKLKPKGEIECIWTLKEFIEYNKNKTSQVVKNITR